MRGVAGHQDPPVAVPLNVSSVIGEARQPGWLSQRQIHAEHAADAVPQLGQGHRLVVVVVGGLLLAGVDPQARGVGRPGGEHTALGWCETEGDPAHPGDLEVAVLEHGHRLGNGGLTEPLDLREGGAGERDVGQVAHQAARAVAANEVSGGHLVRPVRATHLRRHGGVILAQPDHLLPAADLGAELACEVAEQALEPRLREHQQLHRGIGQAREVHMHSAERQSKRRDGTGAGCFESFQQASVAQHAPGSARRDHLPSGRLGSAGGARAPAVALRPGAVQGRASGRSGRRPR